MQWCITELKRIGLELDPKKTDIFNVGLTDGSFSRVVDSFNILLQVLKVSELAKMELIGFPILNDSTRGRIMKKLSEYKMMCNRILMLDGHPGLS